jgi:energy-coupling factor transporter ATP-binding protein EcfA2
MAFKKMDRNAFPPRQWALVGHPGSGKSTFAAQLRGPLLVVDADHRFTEVAGKATGDVYELSDNPADNINAERIAALLRENMTDSGVRTVVVDSLTSILSPLVVEAILDNEAGRNKNRVSAFKDKALAMRLLQDTITGWGCDVLWIYHLRMGLDNQAVQRETTSISAVELARLRRSLNAQLRVVQDGERRGIYVEWARRGRSGLTLWDESGYWQGMPEKIEQAIYGGLTPEQMVAMEKRKPTSFTGPQEAIAWGYEQGYFNDAVHAQNAYDELKRTKQPKNAQEMWSFWIAEVERRGQEQQAAWSEPESVF